MGETVTILVTGATGNVGSAVLELLRGAGVDAKAAARDPATAEGDAVRLDVTDPTSWDAAFRGVDVMFLVRPPSISNIRRDMVPSLEAARLSGVRHIVLLSVQGADRNSFVPHAKIERWLRDSGLGWTFIRPSFFMQNLSTTHLTDIRDRSELVLPAGDGRTAFVDVEDVAAVAAEALLHPSRHTGRAWTPTGRTASTYGEVASVLSAELGREISYAPVGVLRWARHARGRLGMPCPMVAVTTVIYLTARFDLAAGLTDDVRAVVGRAPRTLPEFVHRERDAWMPRT